jgi:hypothetical protein
MLAQCVVSCVSVTCMVALCAVLFLASAPQSIRLFLRDHGAGGQVFNTPGHGIGRPKVHACRMCIRSKLLQLVQLGVSLHQLYVCGGSRSADLEFVNYPMNLMSTWRSSTLDVGVHVVAVCWERNGLSEV